MRSFSVFTLLFSLTAAEFLEQMCDPVREDLLEWCLEDRELASPPFSVMWLNCDGRDSTGNCRRACLRDTRTCVQMSDCLVSWMDRFCTIPAQAGIGNRQDDISTTVRSEAADAGAGENDGFVSDRRSNKIPACERTDADFLDMVSKGASKALLERDVLLSTDMPGLIVSIERAVKQELKVAVPKLQVSTTSKPTQCPIIPDSMSCSNLPDPCPVFPTSISCSNIANGRLHEDDIDRLKTHVESQTNPIKQDTADVKKLTEMVQNMNTNLLNFTSEPASEVFCSNLSDGSLSEEDLNQNFTESLKKVSEQLVELQTNMINVTDILLDFITKDEFSLNTNVSEVLETVQTLITQVNLKLDGGLEGVSKNVQEHDNSSSIRYDDVIDKVTKLNGGVAAIDTGLRDLGVVAERIIEKAKLLVTSSETRGDGQAESIRRVKQVGENVVEIKADLDELSEVAERIEEHAKILLEDTSSQIFFDTLTINLTDTVKDVVSGQFSTFKLSMDDWRNTIQTSIAATGSNYESLVRSHVKAIEVLKQSLPTGEYCEAGTLKITNSMGEIKTDILRHIDSAYAKQKVEIERDIKLLFGSMNESVDARISSADSGVEETDSLHRQDQHETNRYLRSAFLTQEQVLAETERRTEDALFKQMVGIKMEFGNLENIFRTKMATQSIMDGLDRRGELDDVVADLKLSMLQFSVLIANQNATESKRILTEQFKLNREREATKSETVWEKAVGGLVAAFFLVVAILIGYIWRQKKTLTRTEARVMQVAEREALAQFRSRTHPRLIPFLDMLVEVSRSEDRGSETNDGGSGPTTGMTSNGTADSGASFNNSGAISNLPASQLSTPVVSASANGQGTPKDGEGPAMELV